MKNLKELKAILTAIWCINHTSKNKDNDIDEITEYAFRRIFGGNTNLLILCCVGKTKEQIMPEIIKLLQEETKFERRNNNGKQSNY